MVGLDVGQSVAITAYLDTVAVNAPLIDLVACIRDCSKAETVVVIDNSIACWVYRAVGTRCAGNGVLQDRKGYIDRMVGLDVGQSVAITAYLDTVAVNAPLIDLVAKVGGGCKR